MPRFSIPRLTTDEDLYEYTLNTLGVTIPRTAVKAGHAAPFTAYADAYFAKHPVSVWLGARGLAGKTMLLAVLGWVEAVTLRANVSILGGSADQSEKVLEYLTNFWRRPGVPIAVLESDPTLKKVLLIWGNKIRALAASQRQARGGHPERLRLDEADEMDYRILKAVMGQPMGRGDVISQTVISSTHHNPEGTMTKVLEEAREKGWPVFCVAQDTPVLTERGEVAIQCVRVGERVWTRGGWKCVRHVTKTGTKPVVAIVTTDGRVLRVTADHRVATPSGWTNAGQLRAGDALLVAASVRRADADAALPLLSSRRDVGVLRRVGMSRGAVGASELVGDVPGAPHVLPMAGRPHVGGIGADADAVLADVFQFRRRRSDEDAVGQSVGALFTRTSSDRPVAVRQPLTPFPATGSRNPHPGHQVGAVEDDTRAGAVDAIRTSLTQRGALSPDLVATLAVSHVASLHHGVIHVPVWDLGVEEAHEFVAGGVVVHNCWGYDETLEPYGWLTRFQFERSKQTMSAEMWRIEVEMEEPSVEGRAFMPEKIEAMFEGGEFDVEENDEREFEAPVDGASYATGADWGQTTDFTEIATLRADVRPMRLVAYRYMRRRPYPEMVAKLDERLARYPGEAAHDYTGVGRVGEFLTNPVEDVTMVGQKRHDLFTDYVMSVERDEIRAPRIGRLYRMHKFARTKDLYKSGEDCHPPDGVVAMAMARKAVGSGPVRLLFATDTMQQVKTETANGLRRAVTFLRRADTADGNGHGHGAEKSPRTGAADTV